MHGAGAALRQPAAEMRVVQRQLVAQRVEQRHVGIGIDRLDLAVHVEIYSGHGCSLGCRKAWPARVRALGRPSLAIANCSRVGRLVQRAGIANSLDAFVAGAEAEPQSGLVFAVYARMTSASKPA